ncbi:MAG: hypothetical protein GY853_06700 [PVC group bacterium]|nr:hypothetical protein [PVC group bacterium]
MSKELSEIKSYRMEIGYNLLMLMERFEDLPLPNVHILVRTIQEYFDREGIIDRIEKDGYKWKPDEEYWKNHIGEIREYMAYEKNIYFGFLRIDGLKGIWKFMNKGEYERYLIWHNQDISTRVETQNDKIDVGENRWKIDIPKIADVPRIAVR